MVNEAGKRVPLHSNGNIKDFFKPFAKLPPTKRLRDPEDGPNRFASAYRRSKSPRTSSAMKSPTAPSERQKQENSSSDLSSAPSISAPPSDNFANPFESSGTPQSATAFRPKSTSSEAPVSSGSQRTVRHGQQVVTNSDEESDTDCSLEDIETLLRPRAAKGPLLSSGAQTPRGPSFGKRRSARVAKSSKLDPPDKLPPIPQHKFSLRALVARAGAKDAADGVFQEALRQAAELDAQREAMESKVERGTPPVELDKGALASVMVNNETDDIDKLLRAIQRTEALQYTNSWSFFDSKDPALPRSKVPSFKGHPLARRLQASLDRELLFTSTFAAEIAAKGKLPDELLLWILETLPLEERKQLQKEYLIVLDNATPQMESLLTPARIDALFRSLGASKASLDIEETIKPVLRGASMEKDEVSPRFWDGLIHALTFLANAADWMVEASRDHAICILLRLAVDSSVTKHFGTLNVLGRAFAALVDSIPKTDYDNHIHRVFGTIHFSLEDTSLRLQLLRAFPSSSHRLSLIRQRLALSYFYDSASYLVKPARSLHRPSTAAKLLRDRPKFNINPKSTDYPWLTCTIAILDIAVGLGDRPEASLDGNVDREFDEQVDELSREVKDMSTRIMDTGASHMARTEAKAVLEALFAKLEYAVRTKPRPKMTIFGELKGQHGSAPFMQKYVARKPNMDS